MSSEPECWDILNRVTEQVEMIWSSAYTTLVRNEEADKLLKLDHPLTKGPGTEYLTEKLDKWPKVKND